MLAESRAGVWHATACAVLVVLTVAAFHRALSAGFVHFDDPILVQKNEGIRSLSLHSIWKMFVPAYETEEERRQKAAWLPLRQLSYAVDYRLWGLDAYGYHLTNLVLHVSNVLLAYALLVWLLKGRALALLGAAWFAVHPVQVESVTWVSGRRDVLYGLFFFLAVLSYLAYEKGTGRRRWVLYAASVLCCACCLLSKASGMMLPAVLAAYVVVLGRAGRDVRRRLLLLVPHLALAIGATAVHFVVAQSGGVVKERLAGPRVASTPWALATYVRFIAAPVGLATPCGRTPLALSEKGLMLGSAALVAAAVVVAVWGASSRQVGVFGLAWWFLLLLPVSNVVPLSIVLAERYLYLPLLGACMVAASAVGRLQGRLRWAAAGCGMASVLLLAALTHSRQEVWQGTLGFWRQAVGEWPDSAIGRLGMGTAKLLNAQPEQAWEQYQRVVEAGRQGWTWWWYYREGVRRCYNRVGRMREARGDIEAALGVWKEAVRLLSGEIEPRVDLAKAYERAGRKEEAIAEVLAIKSLEPSRPGLDEWLSRLKASDRP
jgi:hypothetical protein